MSIRNQLLQDILSAIGGGGSVLWGSITGNIADQSDLAEVAKTNDYDDLTNTPALSPTGTMFYVHKSGSDSNSGLTTELPLQTIGEAITQALLLIPAVNNQMTIEVMDTGTYFETYELPEWVHINALNAANNGRITVNDSTIIRFRRLQNGTPTQPIVRKTDGTGFARITCDLMIVEGATQEGLLVNMGLAHLDAGVIDIDAGVGIKAKNGARVSFIVPEILMKNGALGLGTRTAGGDPNFSSGIVSYAVDTDDTCTLVESKVTGDIINIQGGSFTANTLFNMGAGTTLNVFSTEAIGELIADPTAIINSTIAGGASQAIARSFDSQTLLIHNGLEATETVIDFGDVVTKDFSIVNGVVEILTLMSEVEVTIEIHLVKTGAQDAEFDCWLEASGDSGGTWVAIAESLRREVIDKDGSSNLMADFSFNVALPVGGLFRIVATNNGANTLSMQKPTDIVTANGGASGFAKKVNLVKIK